MQNLTWVQDQCEMRPAGFEPATKGFKGPTVFPPAWTISPSAGFSEIGGTPPIHLKTTRGRALIGHNLWPMRGLLLSLTPLVSEPFRRTWLTPNLAADCLRTFSKPWFKKSPVRFPAIHPDPVQRSPVGGTLCRSFRT